MCNVACVMNWPVEGTQPGRGRGGGRFPNSKLQNPKPKEVPNTKFQSTSQWFRFCVLEIGDCLGFGFWSLGFRLLAECFSHHHQFAAARRIAKSGDLPPW